ncbi:MAG: hypothetical protein KDD29_07550, partial [Flavobacteriales bacterium]|nr:hypothetical protein [Flavobacteriales bacterium]
MSKKGLDRNSIIGLVIIGVILLVFSYITSPSEEELEKQRIAESKKTEQLKDDKSIESNPADKTVIEESKTTDSTQNILNDSLQNIELLAQYGPFVDASKGEKKDFTLENEKVKITFTNIGGRVSSVELKEFHTYDSLPLILFDEDSSRFNLELTIPGITGGNSIRQINTENLFFEVHNQTASSVALRLYSNDKNQY